MLSYIVWHPDPVLISSGGFTLRWYSLLIVIAFFLAYYVASVMIRREQYPAKIQEMGLPWFLIGLIVGARLGHCFFYEPGYYFANPFEILKVWRGGLSSHGAIVGMMAGMWIYAVRAKMPAFWFYDKLAVVFTLAGVLIRVANLMNSEAVGTPTTLPWGFVFENMGEAIARHPAQLYESAAYLLIFLGLYRLHASKWETLKGGYLTGLALVLVFTARFFLEFVKESAPLVYSSLAINTGQVLSIPLIFIGVYLVWAKRKDKSESG